MATPLVTLITNGGPYMALTPKQRLAIQVYGKLAWCSSSPYNYTTGGTSMTAATMKTAVADMRAVLAPLSDQQLDSARAFMWPRSATSYFAGVKITRANQLADAAITYLASLDMDTLRKMDVWGDYASNAIVNGLP